MAVRDETAKTPCEVHGAKDNERHVCGRRRVGEPAVSWHAEPQGREAYLTQYVDRPSGEPAPLECGERIQACRSGVSVVVVEASMRNVG
jgi:hypothetical protein